MVRKNARSSWSGARTFFIFLKRDHGALLEIAGQPRKALQYEIGNPLTATRMTRHQLPAADMRRCVSCCTRTQRVRDLRIRKPSTLFGQFGDEQVIAVGGYVELERALRRAAE